MSLFNKNFFSFCYITEKSEDTTKLFYETKKYGFSGIVIINSKNQIDNIPENTIICYGLENTDPLKLKKHKKEILIVKGGDEKKNRLALQTKHIDILMQPIKFNHVLAKISYQNSIAIGFDISSIIKTKGVIRIKNLKILRNNLKLARKYNLNMVLTNIIYSIYDLRTPREISAIASLFDMTKQESTSAMNYIEHILKTKTNSYIQNGIEII